MRNDEGNLRAIGGLALFVALTCSAFAPLRAEAEAGAHPRPGGDPEPPSTHCLTPPDFEAPPGITDSAGAADLGREHCDDHSIPHLFWDAEHPEVAVETHVEPGSPLTQTAQITNTGNALLVGSVAELDVGSCTRGIGLLEPGRTTTVSCSGRLPETGRAMAEVFGTSVLGFPVSAQDDVEIALAPPAPPPSTEDVAPPPPPSTEDVAPAPPDLPEHPAPAQAEPVHPEPPTQNRDPPKSPDRAERPSESPARTAGFISVAAVLVMLVSVGALSTATRPGK